MDDDNKGTTKQQNPQGEEPMGDKPTSDSYTVGNQDRRRVDPDDMPVDDDDVFEELDLDLDDLEEIEDDERTSR
jgi:hypothetical protein